MAETKKYEERIADLERALDDAESDAECARELANEVDSNLYYYKEDASERFDELDEDISRVNNRVDELDDNLCALQGRYEELYDMIEDLPNDLVERITALEKENEKLKSQIEMLSLCLDRVVKDTETMASTLNALVAHGIK